MDTETHQYSKHVSVPAGEGLRVDKSIIIHRPVSEVYQFWEHLENLPRFMHGLRSVNVKDPLHSHWVASLDGKELEWDAEIIEQRANEMISWRSAPGADVDNAGSVWFAGMPDGQSTDVRVEMKFVPPRAAAGAALAKAPVVGPEAELLEDLHRLKNLLEAGTMAQARPRSVVKRLVAKGGNRIRRDPWRAVGTLVLAGFVLGVALGFLLRPSTQRCRN